MNKNNPTQPPPWRDTVTAFFHPRVLTMLLLGFSSGLPLLLIFSSLSLWLREAGVERSVVTLFSWAALGYSFKFVWAPLVDALPLPLLTARLGRRRAWMLVSQVLVMAAILCIAANDPAADAHALLRMSVFAVLLGFAAATQDIVIDAYRIESAAARMQALMSSAYIAGYRVGMLVAGAGALFLASIYGSAAAEYFYPAWRNAYLWMAAAMLVGVATTVCIREPSASPSLLQSSAPSPATMSTAHSLQLIRLFVITAAAFVTAFALTGEIATVIKTATATVTGTVLASVTVELLRLTFALTCAAIIARALIKLRIVSSTVVTQSYIQPVKDFFRRYARTALALLALIAVYRMSDIVLGVIANVFYQDMGFTKIQIAAASKTYGLFLSIAGGFLGGALAYRYGVMKILFAGAVLAAVTNLLFLALTAAAGNLPLLYLVISADNLSAGLASAAFVAFLSALTNIRFTAVQFALFTSIMTLLPKALGGYSGAMVDHIGYNHFFIITALLGLPAMVLIWMVRGTVTVADDDDGR